MCGSSGWLSCGVPDALEQPVVRERTEGIHAPVGEAGAGGGVAGPDGGDEGLADSEPARALLVGLPAPFDGHRVELVEAELHDCGHESDGTTFTHESKSYVRMGAHRVVQPLHLHG